MTEAGPGARLLIPADALVVLVAPAGAGKSTFARRHFHDTEIVSSDRCRALVSDDEGDQRATGAAFEVFDAILRGRLALGRLSVADATNLEPVPRQRMRELARAHGRPVVALVLDVPRDLALARNRARARAVPEPVVELHFERFRRALDALPTEGYDALYRIETDDVEVVRLPPDPLPPTDRP